MTDSRTERIKATEEAAAQLMEEAQKLREAALTVEGKLRDELLLISRSMGERAKLMKDGLLRTLPTRSR